MNLLPPLVLLLLVKCIVIYKYTERIILKCYFEMLEKNDFHGWVYRIYIYWNVDILKKIKCYENQTIFPFFIFTKFQEFTLRTTLYNFFPPHKYYFPKKKILEQFKFKNPLKKEDSYITRIILNDHLYAFLNNYSTIDSKPIHHLVISSLEQDWRGEDGSKPIDRYLDPNPDDQSWTNVFI